MIQLDRERKIEYDNREKKGLPKMRWSINKYKLFEDRGRHCIVCGEKYSDEMLHYFFFCPIANILMRAFLKTVEIKPNSIPLLIEHPKSMLK